MHVTGVDVRGCDFNLRFTGHTIYLFLTFVSYLYIFIYFVLLRDKRVGIFTVGTISVMLL